MKPPQVIDAEFKVVGEKPKSGFFQDRPFFWWVGFVGFWIYYLAAQTWFIFHLVIQPRL